jgi:hypothetical protein
MVTCVLAGVWGYASVRIRILVSKFDLHFRNEPLSQEGSLYVPWAIFTTTPSPKMKRWEIRNGLRPPVTKIRRRFEKRSRQN